MISKDMSLHYDVVIVGAGFSGLYQLHKLRKFGFSTRIFEAGGDIGGTWYAHLTPEPLWQVLHLIIDYDRYWNCYPGARVDTSVPSYQYTDPETWDTWEWKERFPGRDHIHDYFKHVDRVWDLSKDISFNTRVEGARWNSTRLKWDLNINPQDGGGAGCSAKYLILCTGFASKPYIPPYEGLNSFRGDLYHTARWPQEGVQFKSKRVAVVGTGASGVQVAQAMSQHASHLTVFQRTPNLALPMTNAIMGKAENISLKADYAEIDKRIHSTYAGFTYDMIYKLTMDAPTEQRREVYKALFSSGGLEFWLGNYSDMLMDKKANDEAYRFYHEKVSPRLAKLDPELAETLLPTNPRHPFGTKRVSLEQRYFEIFGEPNVSLVDVSTNPIRCFAPNGVYTTDGNLHEFDLVVLATGFDSVSGGITSIDIIGSDGISIKDKWSDSIYTYLGLSTNGFPNLFWAYGPQAPTAFVTGPACSEYHGLWILECLRYMRRNSLSKIEATVQAEQDWKKHVNDIGGKGLFADAESWYFGANIPGKPREALNYMAGMPEYKRRCNESADNGYKGFTLS